MARQALCLCLTKVRMSTSIQAPGLMMMRLMQHQEHQTGHQGHQNSP